MIKRIVLDVQHMGKPNKPHDRGAHYEGHNEADLVLKYASLTFKRLSDKGFETFLITFGTYKERHEWINKYNIDLYLACHLNAGGGSYSLVEYYYDASKSTRRLAKIISNNFKTLLDTSKDEVWEIPKNGRGAVCLKNTKPYALLLEPLFIDRSSHLDKALFYFDLISNAIVKSIEEFNNTV